MVLHEQPTDRSAGAAQDAAADGGLAEAARELRGDWAAIRRSLRRLAAVEMRRLRLRVVDTSFSVGLGLVTGAVVITLAVVAAADLLAALRAFVARYAGGGVPELVAGVCGLAFVFAALLTARSVIHRKLVRSTRRALEEIGTSEAARHEESAR